MQWLARLALAQVAGAIRPWATIRSMLSDNDVHTLLEARHGDPFALLGLHADEAGLLWVRALLPGASAVVVHDAATGRRIAGLALRDVRGLFEGTLPRRRQGFDYRLQITWADGITGRFADAYAYGPQIADADLHYLAEGTHLRPFEVLGALPITLSDAAQAVGNRMARGRIRT